MEKKIVITTGTRADYGLLRPIIKKIMKNKKLKLYLIVTGTHLSKKHGYTIKEIIKDKIPIYSKFIIKTSNDTNFFMTKELGKSIIQFATIFDKIKPDINLIFGDRDEMLSSAMSAYHMNIPNVHLHGGDTSGGIDEYTRHAITKISNIHFPATKKSRERLIKLGEDPKYVILSGSTAIDEILENKITEKTELIKKYNLPFIGNEIILVQHSETTVLESHKQIQATLNAILKLKLPTIAIAPNSDPGHKVIFSALENFSKKHSFFHLYQSVPRQDYLAFLKYCGVLIGNSSSGIIEAEYFPTPVINIGIRQKNREKGKNVFDVPSWNDDLIFRTINKVIKMKKSGKIMSSKIYGSGDSSKKIVKYLENIRLDSKLNQKQITY